MDHSPPGSSVHGISQAKILEWVAISFSGGSPLPGMKPASLRSPALVGGFFITCEIPAPPRHSMSPVVVCRLRCMVGGGIGLFLLGVWTCHCCQQCALEAAFPPRWALPSGHACLPGLGPVLVLGQALLMNVASGAERRTSKYPPPFLSPQLCAVPLMYFTK